MNKKEEFKAFAKMHPELVHYVKNGDMTWQKFYEIYDIYGENADAWKNYFRSTTEEGATVSSGVLGTLEKFKNIDMNSIQEHIKTAQKALNLVQELTSKSGSTPSVSSGPVNPRPLNKFFED